MGEAMGIGLGGLDYADCVEGCWDEVESVEETESFRSTHALQSPPPLWTSLSRKCLLQV